MRPRLLALPTLVFVIAGVLLATRALEGVGTGEEGSLASKLGEAERVVVYALTTTEGPRFRVPGGAQEVLLLLHLELPTTAPADASYRFGVVATLRAADGAALWERTLTRRTRQTRAGQRDEGWDYEAAFVPGGRVALSDSGSVELALPAVADGAVLELRLAAAAGLLAADGVSIVEAIAAPIAVVRAYRKIALEASQAEIRRLALATDSGAGRLGSTTYLPWYALTAGQQLQRLGAAWERLAAEGRAGIDYRVRSVYVVPPRPRAPAPAAEPTLTIGRGQPVVVQLHGPGTVEVRAWAIGAAPAGEATVELRLRRLGPERVAGAEDMSPGTGVENGPGDRSLGAGVENGPGDRSPGTGFEAGPGDRSPGAGFEAGPGDRSSGTGAALVQALALPAGERGRVALELAEGWWSLELHTGLPAAAVQVLADAPERHAGPDDHTQHSDTAGRAYVPVDLVGLPMYALEAGSAALPVSLAPEGEAWARMVEVEVRAWGRLAPVSLRHGFFDAAGVQIAAGTTELGAMPPAAFERLRMPGEGTEAVQTIEAVQGGALGFSLGEAPVSEPVSVRLLAPPGATLLRLWSEGPALVGLRGRLPPPPAVAGPAPRWTWPYDQVEGQALRWQHAPMVAPLGFARRADDDAERAAAGQVFVVQAQVRAEATEAVLAAAGQRWQGVDPRGSHARLRLLERVPPGRRAGVLASWGPGDYLRLGRGVSETVDLAGQRPARVSYRAAGSGVAVVGASMAMQVGDHSLRWRVSSGAGRTPLPGRGAAALRWFEGPEAMIVMVDRPPRGASGAALYQSRQVHRLGAGGLTLAVRKPDAGAMAVNVVVYWLAGAPRTVTTLAVEIDGGSPRRREGAVTGLTPGRRVVEVLPGRRTEVVFPDRRGQSGAALARVGVVLGDDLAPGQHTVRVIAVDGPSVWLRFFRAGTASAGGDPLQWNERRDAVTVEDSDAAE